MNKGGVKVRLTSSGGSEEWVKVKVNVYYGVTNVLQQSNPSSQFRIRIFSQERGDGERRKL
jgi:hypothetical protein